MSVIHTMVTAINEQDPETYISVLNDYFILVTYGSKKYIRQNIDQMGTINSVRLHVKAIRSYYSIVEYRLKYTEKGGQEIKFKGEIILERTKDNEWKIYFVSEEIAE
ncbi:hypothetical protein [Desertibacillus haloalkaliphilus]|uniref:hypothetical protein n=1 Tax=Desertibacillus haloalkaliphilus TaxID=1328930 RepID=UPI001C271CD2|nr:hypothetical protein [Desertibacillus haloalkaliphilus]